MPFSCEIIPLSKSHALLRNTASPSQRATSGTSLPRICSIESPSIISSLSRSRTIRGSTTHPARSSASPGVNVLLLSEALQIILTFALPESDTTDGSSKPNPSTSWVFSPREDRLAG